MAEEQEREVLQAALGTVSPEVPDALERAVLERARAIGLALPQGESCACVILAIAGAAKPRCRDAPMDNSAHLTVRGGSLRPLPRGTCGAAAQFESETAQGRRIIAVATRVIGAQAKDRPLEELKQGLDLAGLMTWLTRRAPG